MNISRMYYLTIQTILNTKPVLVKSTIEPSHEKINNLGFRPGSSQIGMYIHRGTYKLEISDIK